MTLRNTHTYTPDFILPNGIVVETKGLWDLEDRKKHLLVREQHPGLDIRLVFSRSASPLRKGAKSSYADWCRKHRILYADKLIPQAWIDEPPCSDRLQSITAASSYADDHQCNPQVRFQRPRVAWGLHSRSTMVLRDPEE